MIPTSLPFAVLLLPALLFFLYAVYRRLLLVRMGAPENRFDQSWRRVRGTLQFAFGQKRVVSKAFGVNHVIIFWSFMVLLVANGAFILQGLFPEASLEALPATVYRFLMTLFDIVSIAALICVTLSCLRRLFFKPAYLDSSYVSARSFEGFFILSSIALLMIAYFVLHGALLAVDGESAPYMPISSLVATMLRSMASSGALTTVAAIAWWVHAVVLIVFICYLPLSKHMHILTAIPNCFLRNLEATSVPPREEFAVGGRFGVGRIDDFTWKDLFDSFSCTECGRCQDACPAHATGKPLNPRQVVHSLKTNLLAAGGDLLAGKVPRTPLIGPEGEGTNSEEAIWACTTCGACLEQCPVFIEQMPKIVKMRRHLVQMEARFPEELLNLFENIEGRSNPWGIAPTERGKWAAHMDVPVFVAGATEYLFFVGCAGAFDSRQKQVTVALASVLTAAGISWGILGKEEKCCGDSLRRLGNEFAFDRNAKENVTMFQEKGVRKIITQCPHCFSTLKNDYRQFGVDLEVIHHSQLLERLLAEGRIPLTREVTEVGSATFHDSCYLGRHNGVYEEPRRILASVTGRQPLEFARVGKGAFCCGGGGGRMWMEEHTGTRINRERVKEAVATGAETVCVACPYCMTMLEDGLKDAKRTEIRVRDLAEVVAEGLRT